MGNYKYDMSAAGLKDLVTRLASADLEVATEMIRRGCFEGRDLAKLHNFLAGSGMKQDLRGVISFYLEGRKLPQQPAWLAALANADRQIAIHAVVNAGMTDEELERFEKLLKLQPDGHLLRQLRVAVELEQNRRQIGGKRSARNRVTTRRG